MTVAFLFNLFSLPLAIIMYMNAFTYDSNIMLYFSILTLGMYFYSKNVLTNVKKKITPKG